MIMFLVTSNEFGCRLGKLIWGIQLGYLSSISRYGNMRPDYLAAFDFYFTPSWAKCSSKKWAGFLWLLKKDLARRIMRKWKRQRNECWDGDELWGRFSLISLSILYDFLFMNFLLKKSVATSDGLENLMESLMEFIASPPLLEFCFFFKSKGHFCCIWDNGSVLQIKGIFINLNTFLTTFSERCLPAFP